MAVVCYIIQTHGGRVWAGEDAQPSRLNNWTDHTSTDGPSRIYSDDNKPDQIPTNAAPMTPAESPN
jgi:hypothetical protein